MARGDDLVDFLAGHGSLAVVCHNNPDPDTLASALALVRIAEEAGIGAIQTFYGGEITHQQNRAFVNLLDVDLERFSTDALDGYDLLAFVDHSVPGRNNDVPEGTPVDVVVDHHRAEGVEGEFVDHREGVGATATIFTEYLTDLDLLADDRLATALLFAIRRETLTFLRGVTQAEYRAAATLTPNVDVDLLRRLAHPAVSGTTIDAIGESIENRTVRGSVLISHTGRITERDAIPQAADYLSDIEGVDTTVVFGIVGDAVEVSARSTDSRVHIGDVLDEAFADIGTAGGHRGMAGGRLPLGMFADLAGEDESLVTMADRVITRRLTRVLRLGKNGSGGE